MSIFSSVSVGRSFRQPAVNVLSSSIDFGMMLTTSVASPSLRPQSVSSCFFSFLATSGVFFANFDGVVQRPLLDLVGLLHVDLLKDLVRLAQGEHLLLRRRRSGLFC